MGGDYYSYLWSRYLKNKIMRKRMNIYLTASKKSLKFSYPAIKSLFANNLDSVIYLYIVSEDLMTDDITVEKELASCYGHKIFILHFDENMAEEKIVCGNKDHWPLATLSCYWLFHSLLPMDVDRIMAMEADTVTLGSLAEFYNLDLENYYAACPAPEHKPNSHRMIMEKIGGDTFTFVMSLYNVAKIREDFSLEDILETDKKVIKEFGHSQQELTFGLLFKEKIYFMDASNSCIEENRQSMSELGYEYILNCESSCKVLHFSSFTDKGKPWNPVCIMPGHYQWWKYAENSPYYKNYIVNQWNIYDDNQKNLQELHQVVSFKNVIVLAVIVLFLLQEIIICFVLKNFVYTLYNFMFYAGAFILSYLVRKLSIIINSRRKKLWKK